jgi:hypothetical protein
MFKNIRFIIFFIACIALGVSQSMVLSANDTCVNFELLKQQESKQLYEDCAVVSNDVNHFNLLSVIENLEQIEDEQDDDDVDSSFFSFNKLQARFFASIQAVKEYNHVSYGKKVPLYILFQSWQIAC